MADDFDQPEVDQPEFDESEAEPHWLWPAIIVSMATLFVGLLVTTVLVWLLRPSRAEPVGAEGRSLAEVVRETVPSGGRESSAVSARPAEPAAEAVAPTDEPKIAPADPVDNSLPTPSQVGTTRDPEPAPGVPRLQLDASAVSVAEPPAGDTTSGGTATLGVTERVASPEPHALARALQELNATRGDRIRAATTAEAKRSLAETLLKQAGQETNAAQRYALLDQARALAVDAGDLRLSLSAIGELDRGFQIETRTLAAEVLKRLVNSATSHEEQRLAAQTAITCAQQAADAGEAELAESLYVIALRAARQLGDAPLEGTIQRGLEALTPVRVASHAPAAVDLANAVTSQEVVQANEVLKRNPRDADAHLTLGKFLCFVKEDWDAGLPHLAYGSDAALSKLARDDMHLPRTSKNLVELADAWYEWGLQTDAATRKGPWSRALGRYTAVSPQLTGVRKERVDQRVAQLIEAIDQQERIRSVARSWLAAPPGLVRSFEGHEQHVTSLALSTDGSLLASAAEDRTVRLWNVGNGQQLWKQHTKTSHLNGIVITPDSQHVISNYDDRQFAVMSAADGRLTRQVGDSPMSPTAVRLSPDGLSLLWAARSRPPNLFVWSLAKDQAVGAYGEGDCPNVLALSRDGLRIATGDSRGVVRVLDTSTGKMLHQLRAHQDAVTDLDISPNGQQVATAALNEICVFDLNSYEPVQTFRVESVRTVAFSPDGRRLASGGFREEVLLWDLQTGRRFDSLKAEAAFSDRYITRIAFLPDPHGLVTGATGGKIRLWRLPD